MPTLIPSSHPSIMAQWLVCCFYRKIQIVGVIPGSTRALTRYV